MFLTLHKAVLAKTDTEGCLKRHGTDDRTLQHTSGKTGPAIISNSRWIAIKVNPHLCFILESLFYCSICKFSTFILCAKKILYIVFPYAFLWTK